MKRECGEESDVLDSYSDERSVADSTEEVVRKEVVPRRFMYKPMLPSGDFDISRKDEIINTFIEKVRCLSEGKPYAFRKFSECPTHRTSDDDPHDDFSRTYDDAINGRVFSCDLLGSLPYALVNYRKHLREMERRMRVIHRISCSNGSGRISNVAECNVQKISNIVALIDQLSSVVSSIVSKLREESDFFDALNSVLIDGGDERESNANATLGELS